jgi:hypothetical protein
MEISSNVARVSGLGEPNMYISSLYNTQAIEKTQAIEPRNYKPKYPSEETNAQLSKIDASPDAKSTYKPGDLVNLYA